MLIQAYAVIDFAQAEARFAEPLGRVQAGEEILVTRADVPACLRRPKRSGPASARAELLRVGNDFDEALADFAP